MSVYDKIKNPETGRMVSIYGKLGKKILANFIDVYQNGGEPCRKKDTGVCVHTDKESEQDPDCPNEEERKKILQIGSWKNKKGKYGCSATKLAEQVRGRSEIHVEEKKEDGHSNPLKTSNKKICANFKREMCPTKEEWCNADDKDKCRGINGTEKWGAGKLGCRWYKKGRSKEPKCHLTPTLSHIGKKN